MRAIIAIYDLVMWLIDNIQRILSFVNSVVDSVSAIATGQIGGAANYIESSIAKTIPMILSGLAQFLKLGGIAKKIQDTIEKVRKPIDKAINKGIGFIVKKVKKWFGKKKPKNQKEEEKQRENLTTEEKKKNLNKAIGIVEKEAREPNVDKKKLKSKLPEIKSKYKLKKLKVVKESNDQYQVEGEINPKLTTGIIKDGEQKHGAAKSGFSVNPKKFDYFFGKVVSGSKHNVARSAQNLKDLSTLGIKNQSQLMKVFNQAQNGAVVSTKTSQYGTTVMRSVNIGSKGRIDVGFFYQGGNMSATPSISTIIPKIY